MTRRLLAPALALLLLLLATLPALAHAQLESSDPAAGSILPVQPETIVTAYTEPLEPRFSGLTVLGPDGRQVDTGPPRIEGTTMAVSLPPGLPDGTYVIQWRALSAVDGHTLRGSFSFAIGAPTAALEAGGVSLEIPAPSLAGILGRSVTYAALALLAGVLLVRFVLLPRAEWPATALRRLAQVVLATCVVLAAATVLLLLDQAMRAATTDLAGIFEGPLLTTLLDTRFGLTILARLALLAALFFLADEVLFRPGLGGRALGLAGGTAALLAVAFALMLALTSHAAAVDGVALVLDMVHLVAMLLWFGGLASLGLVLPWAAPGWPDGPTARSVLLRFSSIALACVALLAATGVYQSSILGAGPLALVATPWGLALLAKIGLFLVLIGFGVWHRRRLARPGSGPPPGIRRAILAESAVAVLVLAAVGALTVLEPAGRLLTTAVGEGAAVQVTGQDGLVIAFATNPAQLTDSRYQVTLAAGLRAVDDAEEVAIRFRNLVTPVGQSEIVLQPIGYGIYSGIGTHTPMDGLWEATVIVRRPGEFDVQVPFAYATGRSLQFAPTGPRLPPLDPVTFGGIGLILLGILVLRWRARRPPTARLQRGGLLGAAVGIILAGSTALMSHAQPGGGAYRDLVNPLTPTPEVLATGRALYQANCLACHGIGARGDGPLAATLVPPPLDLTLHVPYHPDSELFGWITEGVPRTSMPGFGRLTPDERWAIILYLRALAAEAAASP